jgi:hypothetical protein
MAPEGKDTVPQTELSKPQRESIEALGVFHHATADLLLRKLGLSEKSERYLQKELQKLHSANSRDSFVDILVPPKQARFGSRPYVYTLGRQGVSYLRKRGFPIGRYRSDELHEGLPLLHRLAVNEFLLKAQLLETEVSGITLKHYEHEKSLNAKPVIVPVPGREKPVRLSPDLWLVFEKQEPWNAYVLADNPTTRETTIAESPFRQLLILIPALSFKKHLMAASRSHFTATSPLTCPQLCLKPLPLLNLLLLLLIKRKVRLRKS